MDVPPQPRTGKRPIMKDIPHVRRVVAVMLAALSMAAHGSDGSQGSGAGAKEEAHASGQVQARSGASPASPIEIVDSRGDETPGVGLERKYRESGYARVVRVAPSDLGMSDEDVDVSRIRILEGQDLVEDLVAQGARSGSSRRRIQGRPERSGCGLMCRGSGRS